MVVAMVANGAWYKYLMVEVYSLLSTTKNVKKIYLFTETENENNLPYLANIKEKYDKVEIVLLDAHKYFDKNIINSSPNKNSYFTDFALVKLMLSEIINEDKVLYIDADAIVLKDISNLWKYNIDDYYVAGVRDFGIIKRGIIEVLPISNRYINSGVVLFNLKKMREDSIQGKMFDLINTKKLKYPDQDALNIICHEKVYLLPIFYNQCEDVTLELKDFSKARIIHFAGNKDEFWIANRYYSEEWYEIEERFHDEFGW